MPKILKSSLLFTILLAGILFCLVAYINGTDERLAANLPHSNIFSANSIDEFTVETGLSVGEIIDDLVIAGIYVDKPGLITLLEFTGTAKNIRSGTYKPNPNLSTGAVFYHLSKGPISRYSLEFVPGYRNEEILAILENFSKFSLEDWSHAVDSVLTMESENVLVRDAIKQHNSSTEFVQSDPSRALQGYLSPGVYLIEDETTLLDILTAMLRTFLNSITDDLVVEAAQQGLTIHQAIVLASIVEREAFIPKEMPVIASVFLNRLERGMPLQSDATAQYAVASDSASVEAHGWWKTRLQQDELMTLSPYNTFNIAGLPPGPIANPSLEALLAVIYPARSNYLFFLTSPACDGTHSFANTYTEHLQNADLFNNSACADNIE
ncbi:MAG TPA: endolytic transglycosylase MltG [Dehalococcoidia bacterium]|nr:endolytic transglycosylase MltG [Dehalococcoidia bacterium]